MKSNVASGTIASIAVGLLGASNCSLPSNEAMLKSKGNVVNNHPHDTETLQSTLPLPRDPQLAVQEEFDSAKQKNTSVGWELFLRRHPENVLTNAARQELNQLLSAHTKSKEKN
jgi:hypothetical protein